MEEVMQVEMVEVRIRSHEMPERISEQVQVRRVQIRNARNERNVQLENVQRPNRQLRGERT